MVLVVSLQKTQKLQDKYQVGKHTTVFELQNK